MPKRTSNDGVLALDLGTSSVRAVIYDTRGQMLEPTLSDLKYKVQTDQAGQVSSDADALVALIAQSIDQTLKAARKAKVTIISAAASCYWHSLMGIDRNGRPTTELLTWADTRSASAADQLRRSTDERAYHNRTGCFLHASYWPAKLRWLRLTRAAAVKRTTRWIGLGEYLYKAFFGEAPVSLSMASGTGLLDVHRCGWDPHAIELAGITPDQLPTIADWDQPCRPLRPRFARRWPDLADVPWYLPLGDGALANVGADCVAPEWFCATIGTSSALRVILPASRLTVPWGTFVYRLDRQRVVVGGALSEGGNVVRWFTDSLGLGHKKQLEKEAGAMAPDSHGLTVLPFWAGERSPNWRADARAAIAGMTLATQSAHLLRAAMEAISYQFAAVSDAMQRVVAKPRAVVATGGQLVHSPLWSQMLADVLNLPLIMSPEAEASSRGAALLALHAQGKLSRLWSMAPPRGRRYQPRERIHNIYVRARERQQQLYDLLIGAADSASGAAGSDSRTTDLRIPAARR